jgi:hypothetical protein
MSMADCALAPVRLSAKTQEIVAKKRRRSLPTVVVMMFILPKQTS